MILMTMQEERCLRVLRNSTGRCIHRYIRCINESMLLYCVQLGCCRS